MDDNNNKDKSKREDDRLAVGISLGLCLGVAFGIIFDNLALGIGIGLCLGSSVPTIWKAAGGDRNKDKKD